MGILGEQTASTPSPSLKNKSYRHSTSFSANNLYQTMLGLNYPTLPPLQPPQPSSIPYRSPFQPGNYYDTCTGSLEEMNSRRSCSTDSTSRNSMLFQFPSMNYEGGENGNRLEDFIRSVKCSGYGKLSETCGLSISELEAMAARQARQLETQEQLLAAKAQRLRFLKSGGEAERLQRLREKVASQEERLRKLRALRGKVQSNRNANSVLSSDLESLRAVFNEKEKELSLAVAKVEELTRQLEDLRRSNKDQPPNGQQSTAAAELEKLRRELMYRQKLREAQATRVAAQRAALNQRQEETMRVDRRIAELQERLHRKRLLNQQLAATLKHQENTDEFVSVPNKNDPKYQTLPYNAKLFAPFASKHEQDQFEKSMQQMQIIQADHLSSHPQQQQQQQNNQLNQIHQQHQNHNYQQSQYQQHQNSTNQSNYPIQHSNGTTEPCSTTNNNSGGNNNSTSNVLQSISNVDPSIGKANCGNHVNNSSAATINSLQQLHHLLSISGIHSNQQNAKSGNQQQSYGNSGVSGVPSSSSANNGNSAIPASVSTTMATSSGVPNGLQTVHSTQANNNVSRGKALPVIGNAPGQSGSNNSNCINSTNAALPPTFPVIRPSNFYPTGAPPSSSTNSSSCSTSSSSSSTTSTTTSSNLTTSNNGSIINSGLSSVPSGQTMPLVVSSRHNGLLSSQGTACNSNGSSLEISLTGTNATSLSSTSSNDTGFVSNGSCGSGSGGNNNALSRQQQLLQQQQQQQQMQLQLKPALPPKPAKPTPPPRQAHDLFNFNSRSGSAEMVLHDRPDMNMKSKPLFVKSSSAEGNNNTTEGSSSRGLLPLEKDLSNGNNSTVRVSINRRIEMPPAFLFPESDPPPSDLVPEHQHQQSNSSSSASSMMNNAFSSSSERQQSHQSNADNGSYSSQSIIQSQQLLQLSPVGSSASGGDSVDASPLLIPKGSVGLNHQQQQQLLPEEYQLPDLFPSHPASSQQQNVFSSPSAINSASGSGNSKGDQFMNLNNQINSHHHLLHRNAQALIESLGQHASQTMQQSQNSNAHATSKQQREEESHHNKDLSKRTDHNANSSNSNNGNVPVSQTVDNFKSTDNQVTEESGEGEGQSHVQLESNEAVNEKENESCGNNINNNIIATERGCNVTSATGALSIGMDGRDQSPSEVETVTANKGEGNINTGNSLGIVIAPQVTSIPGVLRRVKKSNFKSNNKDHIPIGRRVSFDPLALLLDASLEGELDLVVKTAGEVGNVSAANDEGITALHNAICAGHFDVVRFLVQFGCDVNAQDSDGWTPLHCAASCNNVSMVKFLVEHGACIFATTLSDHETAAEKCEEDEDGFGPCSEYLYSIQEKLGIMNGGVIYAVFDYDAQNSDELSFKEGDRLVILRKGDEYEREWWWASYGEKEGYVPRNLLGLYPRVVPQKKNDS